MSDFKDFTKWVALIQEGCEEMTEPPCEGIPTPLPRCKLTGDACRIDTCPKFIKNQKSVSGEKSTEATQ